ncbi:MAG: TonB family protein [Bacteroidales bacterium]|nr:TonB family protein [Bacteroidales bacterium]
MKLNKDNINGFIGTVTIHAIVLLLLYLCVIKTIIPADEGGILVNFGNVNEAAGTFEPEQSGEEPEKTTPPPAPRPKVPEPKMLTQEDESIALAKEKKKKEEDKRKQEELKRQEEARKKKEAEERKKAEEERKKKEISNKVAGAFGAGSGKGSQGSSESGSGNQGSPFGNSDHGANEGIGGYGDFALDGRSLGAGGLPRPAYTAQEEGRIVISITVDPRGNVIGATIGRGTNIDNASMRNAAIAAARKAKFNAIQGTNNQVGTITYKYRFK